MGTYVSSRNPGHNDSTVVLDLENILMSGSKLCNARRRSNGRVSMHWKTKHTRNFKLSEYRLAHTLSAEGEVMTSAEGYYLCS